MALPAGRARAADQLGVTILSRINEHRQAHGLPALPEDPHLSTVSEAWSRRLAAQGSLSHNPDVQVQYGWPVYDAGEVVGYARNSARDTTQLADRIVQLWMQSSSHRAMILGTGWTDLGVGWSLASNGGLYATVNAISADLPAAGAEALSLSQGFLPGASAPRVVISRSDVPVDGLAGAALADGSAPLLLTRPGRPLPAGIIAEISRVGTPTTRVYLIGAGIDQVVDQQVRDTGALPIRLGGGSRYETAAMVATEVAAVRRDIVRFHIIRADAWADAVSIAGQSAHHGHPILMVDRDGVPAVTRAVLDAYPTADRLVIGGSGAVSDAVVQQIHGRRLAGTDRSATGIEVMRQLWERPTATAGGHLVVTPGWTTDGWGTALAHTTVAARFAAPLLFAADGVPVPVRQGLRDAGYSAATAPTLLFARNVPVGAQQEFRSLTGN